MSDLGNIQSYYSNRAKNATNHWQGKARRVLCVCSAGLLRSPTAAVVLASSPFNFNTRAAGLETDYALIPVDDVLLLWADEVVCMTRDQEARLRNSIGILAARAIVTCLDIEDSYGYLDPVLVSLIKSRYAKRMQEAQIEIDRLTETIKRQK